MAVAPCGTLYAPPHPTLGAVTDRIDCHVCLDCSTATTPRRPRTEHRWIAVPTAYAVHPHRSPGTGHQALRFRDPTSPHRDSPPTPWRVGPPQLPQPPHDLALCDHRGDAREGMTIMNATQTGTHTGPTGAPRSGDPRIGWSTTDTTPAPALRHRRDGILPTIAAALSVRGATLTGTAARGDTPPHSTRSSRTSSTPSPATSATASPDAAPKPSSSPGTSPPPTQPAAKEPPADP